MQRSLKQTLATLLLAGAAMAANLQAASAAESPNVFFNGKQVQFTDVSPQIIQDRTYVPFRALLETLGATVTWDGATRTAIAQKDGITVKISIGKNVLDVNGHPLTMDVPSTIVNDRTLVPLRYVSQALGASVRWDPNSGGQVFVNQDVQDMLNQMVTGQSGDQKVTYEQAAILMQWLNANKDKLPAFTGNKAPEKYVYGTDPLHNPDESQFERPFVGNGKVMWYVPRTYVTTGVYRIEELELHQAPVTNVDDIDPHVLAIIYTVWDTTSTKYHNSTTPTYAGAEVNHYLPNLK
ncbi:copper amine oxidase N-terminal domain-containing protein [Effusibacillus pohliae]|uniref:copper amine oxidase N-terminal domain-containing protein n=1 Tax=Effusibacillus pohliae TaxID=232270 RepID=UPI00037D4876|nr:copper amine oxidase N-terminal domain-containing protein [Effusibacillus pohliae]